MPDAQTERSAIPTVSRHHSATAPLLVWLFAQLVPLSLAAMRVPLSARFPLPAERLALHEMLIGQLLALALLFPLLFRDRSSAIVVIATSLPFLWLAGHLADAPQSTLFAAAGYLVGWMIVLTVLAAMLRTTLAQQIGVAIASVLTLLPPLLMYLHADFRMTGPSQNQPSWPALFPIPAAVRLLESGPWPSAFLPILVALALLLLPRFFSFTRRA